MVFTTEGFVEVAIEWVGFESTTTEFCSDALTDWAIIPWVQLRTNLVKLLQLHWLLSVRFILCLFSLKFSWGNHMSVAEWMTHGIYYWRICWSKMVFILSSGFLIPYRKLAWVGFKPTTQCLPCTYSNHWTILSNDETCLMVNRIKWPWSSSHC